MQTLLVFIAVAALSILASNQRLMQAGRFFGLAQLSASGMLFLIFGALLGPGGVDLLVQADVEASRPLLALGLGLGGVLMGLNLEPQLLRALPGRVWAAAGAHSLAAFVFVAVPIAGVLLFAMKVAPAAALGAAAILGGAASVSSSHFAVLWYRAGRLERVRGLSISLLAMLDDLVGIGVLGLALIVGADIYLGTGVGLVALAILIGLLCGALSAYLIHESREGAEMTAILLGAVGLVSGVAAFLKVSALIAGLSCGLTLAIIGGRRVALAYRSLARTERPVYLMLLFLIGAHLSLDNWYAWVLVPLFVSLRFIGKVLGGRLAANVASTTLPLPSKVGYALIGQGGISLCLLIDYLLIVGTPSAQLIFDVGVSAAVMNEVLGSRAFRRSLPEQEAQRAAPHDVGRLTGEAA